MRLLIVAALALALVGARPTPGGNLAALGDFHAQDIPSGYIIKLRPRASKTRLRAFLSGYSQMAKQRGDAEEAEFNTIKHQYSTAINGIAGQFSDTFLAALKAQHGDDIEYIVPDGIVSVFEGEDPETNDKQDSPPAWGLTRVSQRQLKLPGPYVYPKQAGEGVDVFVVDTGVYVDHTDFGKRATMAANFVDQDMTDGNGHGTHCAGTIGSLTYGVAKKVSIKGVKVLNAGGSGTWSGVLSGVDYVAKNVRKGKTVMSMSLGGGKNQALNDAMNNAVKAGVVAIVAAGNNGGDACQISPASAEGAYSVMATDNADNLASFSNRGKCTKIAAPGVNVLSTWKGGNTATNSISGTSMATPHVAGVAALLMSQKQYNSPQEVYDALTALATKGAVKNMPADSPNLLLFNGATA